MSQRPPAGRPDAARARERRLGAFLFGGFLTITFAVALFPWFPGGVRLERGSIADRAIVAPRDITYDSTVLTDQERHARADAVQQVFVLDTDVRDKQLAQLNQVLASIDRVRGDSTLSESAKETAVRNVTGVSLSARSAATLVQSSAEQFKALGDEARNALGRTLTQSIGASDVSAAQTKASTFFSPLLSAGQVIALQELIDPLIVPTLVVDQERTKALRDEAMANTPPVQVSYTRGQVVVAARTQLTAADIEALDRLDLRHAGIDTRSVLAVLLFAAMLGCAASGYVAVARPRALQGARRQLLFGLLLLVPAAVAKFVLPLALPDLDRHFLAYALPLAAAPMAATVLLDVPIAVLLATLLAAVVVFVSILLPGVDPGGATAQLETARLALTVLASSFAGIYVTARADRLQRFLVAGAAAAVASGGALTVIWLLDADRRVVDFVWIAGVSAGGGILAALIAVGAFVLLSRPFGIITRVELMELAQLTHHLLRRLQDEAPGTFQHSILVGNMAERAADRIGADPLLVRVGAYYHDIGKLVAPAFFVENIPAGETSPHEGLDPLQSTRVIHQHVSGGVELGRKEGLPEAVVRFIPEHHGTRLMTFFYRKAAQLDPQIDEELFRYPGPKPRTRETALVMIADGCEATVRAAADRSPANVRAIIDETIKERIDEGQFDDCDISLRDLRIVAEAYTSTLSAVYHPRVEYPEPTQRERERRAAGLTARREEPAPEAPAATGTEGRSAAPRRAAPEDVEPPQRARPSSSAASRRERELSEDDT